MAYSSPPANPVSCSFQGRNCTVLNSYGAFSDRATCRSSMVVYPTTENELLYVVSEGTRGRQKMCVVTRFSHSMTKLACVDGENSRLISTEYLNNTDQKEELELQRNSEKICTMAQDFSYSLSFVSYGLTNNGLDYYGYPVIGNHSDLMSSGGCLDSKENGLATACPWDSRVKGQFFHQTTFSIPIENVKEFISDIKTLVKIEPKALCGLNFYNGVLIRYVQPSFAYLGNEFEGVEFEFTYYRSRDPLMLRMYEDFLEEIEKMGLFKYGGLPHWGKNRNVAFINAIEKYKDAALFLKVKQMFDPLGLFSSEWTDTILGLRGNLTVDTEGCALEGLCICSKDVHCSPSRGYFCRRGKIYKAAHVGTRL